MEDIGETKEQIEPRKKRGAGQWCVAAIRSVFILLFAVILVGGLYFKAPWKVLVLDALLLVLLTMVPKRIRKYGWFALAAAVLVVTVWIFIPEKDTGNWRPYSFDDEIAAYHAKYAVPDEENAAVILKEISLKYDDTFYHWPDLSKIEKPDDPNVAAKIIMEQIESRCDDFYPDFWTEELNKITLYQPWKSQEYPELKDWLQGKERDIKSLIEASKKPKCQFEYTFNPFPSSKFDDDPGMAIHEWLRILRRAANNDEADGRIDDAIEKYNAILRLGSLFSQQSSWFLAFQGMRLPYDIHKSFSRLILESNLDGYQLGSLEETINNVNQFDFEFLFKRRLEYQRLSMKQIWAMLYQINEHGQVRYVRSVPEKFTRHSFKTKAKTPILKPQRERFNSFIAWFWIPTTPLAMAAQVDKAYDCVSNLSPEEMAAEINNYKTQLNFRFYVTEPLIHSQLKSYYVMYQKKGFFELYRHVYQIHIALKRYKNEYGSWPDGLDQLNKFTTDDILVDPMNEGGFVYRKNGDNFVLYSKGKNGIDNQGIYEKPVYDPNVMTKTEYYKLEPKQDDIQLWPVKVEGSN